MLEPILCGPPKGRAPLLPKLRGHFAEFLDNASPVGLGILSLSTCVGFRYGCARRYSGFSRYMLRVLPYSFSVHFAASASWGAVLPSPRLLRLCRSLHSRPTPPTYVPTVLDARSTGISTCRPSAAPLGLALGPDSPRADQLYPGNLGHPAGRIPTFLSLLIPAFSLRGAPPPLPVRLLCPPNAPLPAALLRPPGFGGAFQPRTFSAQGLSASELLRTLLMCGCF